jgi:DNA-directed RNA polymerase subunit RPC12/RpoP
MSDFITMACPSCGGTLKVDPNSTTSTCEYCGNRHLLKDQHGTGLLERVNACPVCHRNDQVRKLSAHRKGVNPSSLLNEPTRPYLRPKPEPYPPYTADEENAKLRKLMIIWVILLILMVIFVTSNGMPPAILITFGSIPVIIFIFGKLNIAVQQKRGNNENQQRYLADSKKFIEEETRYQQDMAIYLPHHEAYEKARMRYEKTYYCERNDQVFIPGEAETYPFGQLVRLLRRRE